MASFTGKGFTQKNHLQFNSTQLLSTFRRRLLDSIFTMPNEDYQVVELFKHRFYEWSYQRLLEEIEGNFQTLESVKNINSYRNLLALRSCSRSEQIGYATSLFRNAHKATLSLRDDQLTEQDRALWKSFYLLSSRFVLDNATEDSFHQQISRETRQALLKALKTGMSVSLGQLSVDGTLLIYEKKISRWTVQTMFDVTSTSGVDYSHSIRATGRLSLCLLSGTALLQTLGLGQTRWKALSNLEVLPALESISSLCSEFFSVITPMIMDL